MKKLFTLLLAVLSISVAKGQKSSEEIRLATEIRKDIMMNDYVWAVGTGITKEEADASALNFLNQLGMQQTTLIETNIKNENSGSNVSSGISTKAQSVGISTLALDKTRVIFLDPQDGMEVALRFMTRADWEKRDEDRKQKIMNYLDSAEFAMPVEDQLRFYSWANILLTGYSKQDITYEGTNASITLGSKIRQMLNDIQISVIGIEEDKQNKNYPYKVMLDFMYQNKPISSLTFGFLTVRVLLKTRW